MATSTSAEDNVEENTQDKTSADRWSAIKRIVKRVKKNGRSSIKTEETSPDQPASSEAAGDEQRPRVDSDLKLRSLQNNFNSQQDVMKELTLELTAVKEEISKRDAMISEYEAKIEQINSDHHKAEEKHQLEINSLREKVEQTEVELSLSHKAIAQQKLAIVELKTAIKNKDIHISELHLSLNDTTLQLTQAEDKLAALTEKKLAENTSTLEVLQQQEYKHTIAITSIQHELLEKDEAVKKLEIDMDTKDKEILSLKEQLETVVNEKDLEVSVARETMNQQQHDIALLRDEVANCRTTIEDNRYTMDELTKELNDELMQIKQGLNVLKEQLAKKEQD